MTYECICSDQVESYAMEMFLFWFYIGTECGAIMFAMATGTTISCSLGRQYGPVLRLSFLDAFVFF
jgi:hypothetical protein